jgi:hypothetical protein
MLKKARLLTRPPQRAETRFVPHKAAASEKARRTLRYVEPLNEDENEAGGLFNIRFIRAAGRLSEPFSRRSYRERSQIPLRFRGMRLSFSGAGGRDSMGRLEVSIVESD